MEAQIKFQISNSKSQMAVYTTRPDTIFGVDFMVLAPEHEPGSTDNDELKNERSRRICSLCKKPERAGTDEPRKKYRGALRVLMR